MRKKKKNKRGGRISMKKKEGSQGGESKEEGPRTSGRRCLPCSATRRPEKRSRRGSGVQHGVEAEGPAVGVVSRRR
jgi:hypothetical protein